LFDSNRCTGEKMPSLRTARLLGVLLVSLSIFSLAAIHSTVPAHALSGPILSFNPASQPLASAGSTVTVNVNVTNISHDNPLFGWTIYVDTNAVPGQRNENSILDPIDLTLGSFLQGATQEVLCIDGRVLVGPGCGNANTPDGPGVVHTEVYSAGGGDFGNGTLFTITYKAVGGPYTFFTFAQAFTSDGNTPLLFDQLGHPMPGVTVIGGDYGDVSQAPKAGFEWAPKLIFEADMANFTAKVNSTTPGGTRIVDYNWTLTQGSKSAVYLTGVNVTYHFGPVDAGNWTMTLIVVNNLGHPSRQHSETIVVHEKPAHDIGISSFSSSLFDNILAGTIITFNVNVQNFGTHPENRLNVTLAVADKTFQAHPSGVLAPKLQEAFIFTWNTTGYPPDTYSAHAHVDPVVNQTDTTRIDEYFTVRIIYPLLPGALLSLNITQFSGIVILSLLAVSFVVYLVRRGRNRRLLANQELV